MFCQFCCNISGWSLTVYHNPESAHFPWHDTRKVSTFAFHTLQKMIPFLGILQGKWAISKYHDPGKWAISRIGYSEGESKFTNNSAKNCAVAGFNRGNWSSLHEFQNFPGASTFFTYISMLVYCLEPELIIVFSSNQV